VLVSRNVQLAKAQSLYLPLDLLTTGSNTHKRNRILRSQLPPQLVRPKIGARFQQKPQASTETFGWGIQRF
jgi:hypothetical protein